MKGQSVPLKNGDLATWQEILHVSKECAELGKSFGELFEALREFGYSRQTVANWITHGYIPYYRPKASRGYEPVNSQKRESRKNLNSLILLAQ